MVGVKKRAVHFDFCWQRIPRTVNPRAGTTQAASLRRLVGVARGPIGSNRSNRVETSAAYTTKTILFYHVLLWQCIAYDEQRIDCGVVAKSRMH